MSITINTLLFLDQFVSRYCLGLLFLLGIIGLTLNTIIFTRRTFRNTSCILYLLSSNFANYLVIYFVLPCRFFADGFNIDPTTTSSGFCKFREYIVTISRTLAAWFIVFALLDRLMSSSRNIHHRQFCHIHIARWMISFITIFFLIFFIYILIVFTNHAQDDQCEASIDIYRIMNDCFYSIIYIIIPSFLMLIFGLLTINNQKQRRIMPAFRSLYIIKRDRNLVLMLIFQFILFTITTLPQAVQKLYTTLTIDQTEPDDYQNVLNNLFIHTVRMISFINHSCQFYIFTLSSKLFRQEFKKILQPLIRIQHKPIKARYNNQVHFQLTRKIQ